MKETLTILHTNDLHGHYDLALRQAALIKKRKQELLDQGENVIVLDGGDHMDLSMNECLATSGAIHLEMLAATGYDAMTVGNNELLRLPMERIRELSQQSKVPWLLLNIEEADGSQIGGTKETLLLEVGEHLKIGLFGATDQFEDTYEKKHGLRNKNTVKEIELAVEKLRNDGANLIIFLSHMGYHTDLGLTKELSGLVDVIVGAHSHTVLNQPEFVSDIVVVQAGSFGKYLGELKVTVDTDQKKVVDHTGHLTEISMDDVSDPELSEIVDRARVVTDKFLSEIIYNSDDDIIHEELVKLMAHSVKDFWQSDIGIMYGGAASSGVAGGDITKGDIVNACKSMQSSALIELTGEQIAGLLNETLNEEITNRKVYGNGFRPQGGSIGKLQFAGVIWTELDNNISDIQINGEPIDFSKTYTIGTGMPLVYEEVSGYPSVNGNKLIDYSKVLMVKDIFIDYLRKCHSE
ncbi:bifunctional metallophosphatase/5'-nucleotidase [Paenisporosarcina quisquiliarum]|uniref:bifunctional metallophosphatase/5'-nucleotidase n=1 Tax=Paenisporosarcina quisquiliarum TaxID=365346 RepID=UPI0037357F68